MKKIAKFVIVGTQRTGTTLIRTTLGNHPDIRCLGEVFKLGKKPYREEGGYWKFSRRNLGTRIGAIVAPARSTNEFLNSLFDNSDAAAVGFKLMLSHCEQRPYIWPILTDLGVMAIWVRRANALKTLVSRRTAAASGIYHVARSQNDLPAGTGWRTPENVEDRSILIDTGTLLSDLDRIDREQAAWSRMLGDRTRYIEVVYEEYVANKQRVNDAMLQFLGVRRLPIESGLHKINPDKLSQLIRNYDQVVAVLTGTRFEECLDQQ